MKQRFIMRSIQMGVIMLAVAAPLAIYAASAWAQGEGEAVKRAPTAEEVQMLIFKVIAAGGTMGLSVIAAAYAVGKVGAAAMGAASEKPEVLNRALVFVALGEGLAILGLVVAVMIIGAKATG